jgi:hypothetical protein
VFAQPLGVALAAFRGDEYQSGQSLADGFVGVERSRRVIKSLQQDRNGVWIECAKYGLSGFHVTSPVALPRLFFIVLFFRQN